jgi:carnitine-CoA ligase
MANQPTEQIGLLRGQGPDLGEHARRYAPEERTLLRVLRDQANARPDKQWLVFDGGAASLTFREAYEVTNQVGHAVIDRVGEGAHVGLLLHNQREFMPAFLGAQAAGGVSVPLNPDARGPLLHHVIEASEASLIVARTDLFDTLANLEDLAGVEVVVAVGDEPPDEVNGVPVVSWGSWLEGAPSEPPRELPAHHEMALLQFTSGTTGRQKGAIYSHHFLHLFGALFADSQQRTPDDVLMTPLPLCHVAALHLVADTALHAGCTAHLYHRFSATEYLEQVAESGATWSIILGPMAAMVLKRAERIPDHRLESLFCVPPPPEREAFEERVGVTMLWQGFGMTEIFPIPMPTEMREGVAEDTIGMPVSWMEYGVVDEHDRLLPPDTVGEMVFRPLLPYGMVDGYYKEADATVGAFRNFMFHTGDLATYDEQGLLHYRGRKQERIRRRGENVSALELEFVALRHTAVVEAAAYGVPSELGEEDVKLDVVLGGEVSPQELHAWLRENLPRYMVPRYLEVRDGFPKTPSERVQKWRLKQEPVDRPDVMDTEAGRR